MATSEVSIASNALLLLGDSTISSFDEGTTRATLAANLFDDIRDATLRMHPWNFATKRVELAPLAAAPAFEWPYQFQLPGDWIRTLSIGEDGETAIFVMEDGKILFDEATLQLRYIYRHEDVPHWESLFVMAMTAHLAVAMAYPITKSAATAAAMEERLKIVLQSARTVNGQEDTGESLGDQPLRAARYAST